MRLSFALCALVFCAVVSAQSVVYPNPAGNEVNISMPVDTVSVSIYNTVGIILYSVEISHCETLDGKRELKVYLEPERYPEGVYFALIQTRNGKEETHRFNIVR